jgi:hypothetical protein
MYSKLRHHINTTVRHANYNIYVLVYSCNNIQTSTVFYIMIIAISTDKKVSINFFNGRVHCVSNHMMTMCINPQQIQICIEMTVGSKDYLLKL